MTQNQCVLHVGVPKAGSTSIQLSLFYRLRDPGFRYLSFGNIHSNVGLRLVFEADEEADEVMDLNKFEFYGISSNKIEMLRARYREKLLRAVADAQRKERTLILSSEAAWRFNSKRFEKIRDFFHAEGMQPTIVVYCRSPGDWLSSWYQQSIKMGYSDLDDILERLERVDFLAYEKKIRMFDQVFGAENVRTHLFDPKDFPGRCVVRHFCHEQGIEISPQTIIRDNDSVSSCSCTVRQRSCRHPVRPPNPSAVWSPRTPTALLLCSPSYRPIKSKESHDEESNTQKKSRIWS